MYPCLAVFCPPKSWMNAVNRRSAFIQSARKQPNHTKSFTKALAITPL